MREKTSYSSLMKNAKKVINKAAGSKAVYLANMIVSTTTGIMTGLSVSECVAEKTKDEDLTIISYAATSVSTCFASSIILDKARNFILEKTADYTDDESDEEDATEDFTEDECYDEE